MVTKSEHAVVLAWFCFIAAIPAGATSWRPIDLDQHIGMAAAIFRGNVARAQSYQNPEDGRIYTRTVFRVEEAFKGRLPALVAVVHRGGSVNGRGEANGLAPQFHAGEERLMFVSRRADGALQAARGSASALALPAGQALVEQLRGKTTAGPLAGGDVTDQAAAAEILTAEASPITPAGSVAPVSTATNLLAGGDRIPARFVLPDRGDPIPYWIDADYLPSGISRAQAINAVQTALAAWTNVTSLRFAFAGLQSFGRAAPNVAAEDGALRIQLHDHYNYLATSSGDTLGQGGLYWTYYNLTTGWTTGGNVKGNDFHRATGGYVVLQHNSAFVQNLANFTEVLCHELGHTFGLAHSSVNPAESNPVLKQSIMYYTAHGDGRGAQLNSFDIAVCQQVHPPTSPPPYCYDRVIDAITTSTRPINVPGVNTVKLRAYAQQAATLTFATADPIAQNGTFNRTGDSLVYVPGGFYSDSGRLDPANGEFYDLIYARCSDGMSASPYAQISVISFNADHYGEGIPDAWRLTWFGSANPGVGAKHRAADDADGDGFSNLAEYWLGSNPTDKNSNLRLTSINPANLQWQAKAWEVYEVYGSTNLSTWTRARNPIVAINAVGAAAGLTNFGPKQFFRVQKVP